MESIQDAKEYIDELIGTPYVWWKEGDALTEKAPFWVSSDPPPTVERVRQEGCNCAGFLNLLCRKLRIPIPSKTHPEALGGSYGWFESLKVEQKLTPIDNYNSLDMIPVGSVLLRNFHSEEDQGHVAIVISPGLLAHSWAGMGVCIQPIKDSYDWTPDGYYTHVWSV
jgi:cell wall-associated NlpC family hydrolase